MFVLSKPAVLSVLVAACLSASTVEVYAAHGVCNPMSPRQLNTTKAEAEYTYGYSLLAGHSIDTLEGFNRGMWFINYDILDHYLLRPVAHAYSALPDGVQSSVGHFFANLGEVNNFTNNLFIGEFGAAGTSAGRFLINSTLGLVGLFDVASSFGLEYTPMQMKTVLGKAGVEQGTFLMVPAYGPTTARDIHGDTIDSLPWIAFPWPITISKFVIQGIHSRAQLIDQESVVDNAFDPYVQTRDVFLMYDENKINPVQEGEVKVEDSIDEEFLDEIDG